MISKRNSVWVSDIFFFSNKIHVEFKNLPNFIRRMIERIMGESIIEKLLVIEWWKMNYDECYNIYAINVDSIHL